MIYEEKVNLMRIATTGLCFTLLMAITGFAFPFDSKTDDANTLIYVDDPAGKVLLEESGAQKPSSSYADLAPYFKQQKNGAFCRPASAACVLNSIGVTHPKDSKEFTQDNFFTANVEQVVPAAQVSRLGMTLDQLSNCLKSHGVSVKTVHAQQNVEAFRTAAIDAVKLNKSRVIVNYLRSAIGQKGFGHHSVLGGYHQATDRFLILDVNQAKYPPVWVKTEVLFKAMQGIDSSADKSRGYIIVQVDQPSSVEAKPLGN